MCMMHPNAVNDQSIPNHTFMHKQCNMVGSMCPKDMATATMATLSWKPLYDPAEFFVSRSY